MKDELEKLINIYTSLHMIASNIYESDEYNDVMVEYRIKLEDSLEQSIESLKEVIYLIKSLGD